MARNRQDCLMMCRVLAPSIMITARISRNQKTVPERGLFYVSHLDILYTVTLRSKSDHHGRLGFPTRDLL
jgi:hypothetical protein